MDEIPVIVLNKPPMQSPGGLYMVGFGFNFNPYED